MLRAIIVGGDYSADYIIKAFAKNHIPTIVINENKDVAKYITKHNHISVYCSPTNKLFTYRNLNVDNYDLVVALENDDVKNYVIISLLKTNFNVKRAICKVSNPDNVEIFKQLGVDTPISSSHLLAQRILNDSNIESVMKTLSLENDQIVITEITLKKNYKIVDKTVKDINFPIAGNISCIYRTPKVIIPNGNTILHEGDRLVVCTTTNSQKSIIEFIKKE